MVASTSYFMCMSLLQEERGRGGRREGKGERNRIRETESEYF